MYVLVQFVGVHAHVFCVCNVHPLSKQIIHDIFSIDNYVSEVGAGSEIDIRQK